MELKRLFKMPLVVVLCSLATLAFASPVFAQPMTWQYGYDAMVRLTTMVDPNGQASYTYDAVGNVLTKTDARGKLTQYTYDNGDRLTRAHYATGTDSVFEYDGGSTPVAGAIGQLTKITDASGQTVYTYDGMSRKTSKVQTTNGKTFTVGYTWGDTGTALDKLTAITYPSGTRVNYSYDAYGDVNAITVNPPNTNGVGTNTGSTLPMVSAITRNAESKITGWAWASTKTQSISYDGNGQIAAYNLGDPTNSGVRRTVGRDNAGRITGYTHTSNGTAVPTLDQSFGYDNLNRLVSATMSATSLGYSYDATGNRTTKLIGATTYSNTVAPTSNRYGQISAYNLGDPTGAGAAAGIRRTVGRDNAGRITSHISKGTAHHK